MDIGYVPAAHRGLSAADPGAPSATRRAPSLSSRTPPARRSSMSRIPPSISWSSAGRRRSPSRSGSPTARFTLSVDINQLTGSGFNFPTPNTYTKAFEVAHVDFMLSRVRLLQPQRRQHLRRPGQDAGDGLLRERADPGRPGRDRERGRGRLRHRRANGSRTDRAGRPRPAADRCHAQGHEARRRDRHRLHHANDSVLVRRRHHADQPGSGAVGQRGAGQRRRRTRPDRRPRQRSTELGFGITGQFQIFSI